jgi:hypothetical protein
MEIKSRIIPAKPRNKELYFLKSSGSYSGGVNYSSSSNTGSQSYWELVSLDELGNPLAKPYIKTVYPVVSEEEITAYGIESQTEDNNILALYQLVDVDPSIETAPEGSILKKIGTHWFAVDGNLQSDKNFIYDQQVLSTTWNINHNLNKFPSVLIVDNSGTIVEGEIKYIDLNNITINFNIAFKGKAYIN